MIKDVHALPQFFGKRRKRFVPFQTIFHFQEILKEAISCLSREDRILLALRYQEGLSFEEMGEILAEAPEIIWERFHGVMKRIRQEVNFLGTSPN